MTVSPLCLRISAQRVWLLICVCGVCAFPISGCCNFSVLILGFKNMKLGDSLSLYSVLPLVLPHPYSEHLTLWSRADSQLFLDRRQEGHGTALEPGSSSIDLPTLSIKACRRKYYLPDSPCENCTLDQIGDVSIHC